MTNNIYRSSFLIIFLGWIYATTSCNSNGSNYDASGTFEATEVIVSSEVMGRILAFSVSEGDLLEQGQKVVLIDSLSIQLQKAQLEASIEALSDKRNDPLPQINVLRDQLKTQEASISALRTQKQNLLKDQQRIQSLFEAQAATEKQLDDINGQIDILNERIKAATHQKNTIQTQIQSHTTNIAIQNRGIVSERKPIEKGIELLDDQISRCVVSNPIAGTVLSKYMHAGEYATIGKPLYKVADLSKMILRAYISGSQLPSISIGQEVTVQVDASSDSYKKYTGKVSWIANEAEFTPKTIQTKDERANLVYAIKIEVPNDNYLKIGMYGEVIF